MAFKRATGPDVCNLSNASFQLGVRAIGVPPWKAVPPELLIVI